MTMRFARSYVSWPTSGAGLATAVCTFLLRREGVMINREKTQRLYREEGLAVRRRRSRRRAVGIDRSILAGRAGQAAHLLDPIASRIREEGLKAAKLHSDDTPVPMCWCPARARPRRDAYGPTSSMTGPVDQRLRRWCGTSSPPIAAGFIPRAN